MRKEIVGIRIAKDSGKSHWKKNFSEGVLQTRKALESNSPNITFQICNQSNKLTHNLSLCLFTPSTSTIFLSFVIQVQN